MARVFVERRTLSENTALTWDIAHHLYTRVDSGRVVIIADNPTVLLAALRKQWLKVIGKIRKEYSSSINPLRKQKLEEAVAQMSSLSFTARGPANGKARVSIVELSDLPLEPSCPTIYITYEIGPAATQRVREAVSHGGLLVTYHRV